MEGLFAVLLLICMAGTECTKDSALLALDGQFVNATDSKTPCEDWLLVQLEYNASIVRDPTNIVMHFECILKK